MRKLVKTNLNPSKLRHPNPVDTFANYGFTPVGYNHLIQLKRNCACQLDTLVTDTSSGDSRVLYAISATGVLSAISASGAGIAATGVPCNTTFPRVSCTGATCAVRLLALSHGQQPVREVCAVSIAGCFESGRRFLNIPVVHMVPEKKAAA